MKKLLFLIAILILVSNHIISQTTDWFAMGRGINAAGGFYYNLRDLVISQDNTKCYFTGYYLPTATNADGTEVTINSIGAYVFAEGNYYMFGEGTTNGQGLSVLELPSSSRLPDGGLLVGGTFLNFSENSTEIPNTAYAAIYDNAANQWVSLAHGIQYWVTDAIINSAGNIMLTGFFSEAYQTNNDTLSSSGIIEYDIENNTWLKPTNCQIPIDQTENRGPKVIREINPNEYLVGSKGVWNYGLNNVINGYGDTIPYTGYLFKLVGLNDVYALDEGVDGGVYDIEIDGNNPNRYFIGGAFQNVTLLGGSIMHSPGIITYLNGFIEFPDKLNDNASVYSLKWATNQLYLGGNNINQVVNGSNVILETTNILKIDLSTVQYKKLTNDSPTEIVNAMDINEDMHVMVVGGGFLSVGGVADTKIIAYFTDDDNPALPVELTSFTATADKIVILNWMTATEVNNYGFEIERQYQNQTWEKIGFVSGSGNSNSPKEYSFIDKSVQSSGKYFYRLKQIDIDGSFEYSEIVEVFYGMPDDYSLAQNYPNPFNPTTTIGFTLPTKTNVKLTIFNILGQEVVKLISEEKEAGFYNVKFNASNLPSGMYVYKLAANEFTQTKKMLLIK